MEKKCCICGKIFEGYDNNAQPVRKGICCGVCNVRYIFGCRVLTGRRNTSYEIAKNRIEVEELSQKLKEKGFVVERVIPWNKLFHNPKTDEDVIICIL